MLRLEFKRLILHQYQTALRDDSDCNKVPSKVKLHSNSQPQQHRRCIDCTDVNVMTSSCIPGFCEDGAGINGNINCTILVGYKAVYRVCFGMSMCFLAFALIMINVKNSRDPRSAIHNGFWFFKVAAMVAVTVGAFYIPEGPFTRTWFVVGTCGRSASS
ncbi:unnamed protein product [Oncorhynchus mykiss]|uniref:Uncharacterized protein n=1 Tax=Oncorhynchus mykiss TaxID=8022 RepID=A0A060WDS9_ONCMY|nr:unnamed protein product [Oncorhynchus mykiss]